MSALVHSSTLVTAGVYLLIRVNLSLAAGEGCSCLVLGLGAATLCIASLTALFEVDIKKIIALSTLRQLGVMVVALGLGSPNVSLLHLLAHAFFKANLFISAGDLIHNSADYQDLRTMGRGSNLYSLTNARVLVSLSRLRALPFISAFFSKELILETMMRGQTSLCALVVFLAGVGLTALYSVRLVVISIGGSPSSHPLSRKSLNDYFLLKAQASLGLLRALGGCGLRYYLGFNEECHLYSSIFKGVIYTCLLSGFCVAAVYNT